MVPADMDDSAVNLGFGLLLQQIPEYGAQYQKWLSKNTDVAASIANAIRTYAYRPLESSKFMNGKYLEVERK